MTKISPTTPNTYVNVTDEGILKATGKNWNDWFKLLELNHALKLSHKEIVELLKKEGVESNWWRQKITLGFLTATGRRKVGQQADEGFNVGARKIFPLTVEQAWILVTSERGMNTWLQGNDNKFIEAHEDLKVISPNSHLRMRFQLPGWMKESTIQVRVIPTDDPHRSTISFHQENLATELIRDEMRKHWKTALNELMLLAETYD